MKALFLRPPTGIPGKNIVRDFIYGSWCDGKRIGGTQMPPLNEIYIATHVNNSGIEAEFLDAQLEPERLYRYLREGFRSFIAVIIMSSTQSFKQDVKVLGEIKDSNPNIVSILFGSHANFMSEYCLKNELVDFIVRQEPEETVRYLLHAIAEKTPHDDLPGIGYRDHDGKVIINQDRPFMEMDLLPIPDRSLLPDGVDYFNPVVRKVPYTTMQTSRGCPWNCIFCTSPVFYGNRYRYRSAENVMEELREVKRLGYREVFFRDETFTALSARNSKICEQMIRENIDLSWIANGRVDMIDKETMRLMKRAGCHMLKFGVETGSDELLRNYKKGTTVAQVEKVFRDAHEIGMDTHAHMVIGGPGETFETIKQSINLVKRIEPTTVSFGILTPYPGTELFKMVSEQRPEIRDGSESTMQNLHTEGFYSEAICGMKGEELSQAVVNAYRKFYFRPKYIFRRLLEIDSFEQLMIRSIAGINVFSYSLTGRK